ncbi:FeoB-associated Cys-rich membrane protein [Mesobacillus subterraneus]|uniref:FeoB-associated Cys-rich membrane protein n=1 Tax=Mesobacillus subterraneus TaxID=285983 RepID=A0A427TXN6_9BACI|nr:FeoB-associated Cys-rich membrane protein [Mesobacillus subterraneus]RSD29238.1 FeoB-associated Cys-rich membrane protein [Mesobacillus subterraneus]
MIANLLIGSSIFGYAGWALYRFIQKSKQGKCAACSIQDSCSSSCSISKDKK